MAYGECARWRPEGVVDPLLGRWLPMGPLCSVVTDKLRYDILRNVG